MIINAVQYQPKHVNSSLNSKQDNKNVSFKGLTSVLKRASYKTPKGIAAIMQAVPNHFVGTLPPVWVQKIPKEYRAPVIKRIQKGFSEAIRELQKPNIELEKHITKFVETYSDAMKASDVSTIKQVELLNEYISKTQMDVDHSSVMKKAQRILEKTLIDNGLCDRVKLEYINSGEFSNAYKVSADDNEFVLKIYKKFHHKREGNVFEKMMDELTMNDFKDEMDLHGHLIEPNRSLFWQKNVRNHQNARMYFSDTDNGGSLSDFKSIKSSPPIKEVAPEAIGLEHTDLKNTANSLNGWTLDGGGQRIVNETIANNTSARKIYFKIANAPEGNRVALWNRLFKSQKANRADVEMGLANAAGLIEVKDLAKLEIPETTLRKWLRSDSVSYDTRINLLQSRVLFK